MDNPIASSPVAPDSRTYTGTGMRSHAILIVLFLVYMSDYIDRYVSGFEAILPCSS